MVADWPQTLQVFIGIDQSGTGSATGVQGICTADRGGCSRRTPTCARQCPRLRSALRPSRNSDTHCSGTRRGSGQTENGFCEPCFDRELAETAQHSESAESTGEVQSDEVPESSPRRKQRWYVRIIIWLVLAPLLLLRGRYQVLKAFHAGANGVPIDATPEDWAAARKQKNRNYAAESLRNAEHSLASAERSWRAGDSSAASRIEHAKKQAADARMRSLVSEVRQTRRGFRLVKGVGSLGLSERRGGQ